MSRRGLVLVGTLAPPSGGIDTHLRDLSRALRGLRHLDVRFADVRPGAGRSAAGLSLIADLVAARARGDLLHVHTNGHNLGSWRLIRLCATVAAGATIVTLHSGLAPQFINRHPRLCREALRPAASIVCVSEAIAAALRRAGADTLSPSLRIAVAPAFLRELPCPLSPAGLAAIRRRHRPLLLATVGNGREYGAPLLLSAFAELLRSLPEAGLCLCGPSARAPFLDETIRRLGIAHAVPRLGDLERAELLAVIAAADVYVRPTLTDGDSISVREALALGTRVVASDAVPRPEGTRLFRSDDAAALTAAIYTALESPAPAPCRADARDTLWAVYHRAGLPLDFPPRPSSPSPMRHLRSSTARPAATTPSPTEVA